MNESRVSSKVLFICHDSSRTGAPLLLLHFLEWLIANTKLEFEVLVKYDGELRTKFEDLSPTRIFAAPEPPPIPAIEAPTIPQKILFKLGIKAPPRIWSQEEWSLEWEKSHKLNLKEYYRRAGVGLIYSNTITNGEVLDFLSPLECPVITHVHELKYWINSAGKSNFEQVTRYTTLFIAASDAVRSNLIQNFALPKNKIEVIHAFIPLANNFIQQDKLGALKKRLSIEEPSFVIVGSGLETWRKGKDLFLLLALRLRELDPNGKFDFIWVGGWDNSDNKRQIFHDCEALDLESTVHFVGQVTNPMDYFALGDVFALVSREDPFPLVCLEAASIGMPVVCFEKAGGMPEFIEDDCGFVVPYLNINAMAERILFLYENPKILDTMGQTGLEKVNNRHSIDVAAPRILKIIEDIRLEGS